MREKFKRQDQRMDKKEMWRQHREEFVDQTEFQQKDRRNERRDKISQKVSDHKIGDSKEEEEEKRYEAQGRQDQRTLKNAEVRQHTVRNDDLTAEQKVNAIVMNQRLGEWPGCKGNDLQGRHRKINKTFSVPLLYVVIRVEVLLFVQPSYF